MQILVHKLFVMCSQVGPSGRRVFITQGTWDVMDLLGYDEDSRMAYGSIKIINIYSYITKRNKDSRYLHFEIC